MPKLSGTELYEKSTQLKPEMRNRFIFITGDISRVPSEQFSDLGEVPCLMKPVDMEKFMATIGQALNREPSPLEMSVQQN